MSSVLAQEPTYFRSTVAKSDTPKVERKGGYRKAGVIRDVSVITRGEALGHNAWVDTEMLGQVTEAVNRRNKGVKSRFTHPSLSGDGLGRFVGRIMDARLEGDRVKADLHFSDAGHSTPDGDLASYLMDLAEQDGDSFGLSIAFARDTEAEEKFASENTIDGLFSSPDNDNENDYKHVRLATLRAVDAVDTPAANPDGLFHQGQDVALEADAVASYAFGLSEDKPDTQTLFGVDAERVRQFVGRYLTNNNLSIQEASMAEESTQVVEEEKEEATQEAATENTEATEETTEDATQEPGTEAESSQPETAELSTRTEGERFLEAFGDQGGVWFAQGKTFNECQELFTSSLKDENEKLRKQLASLSHGEDEPVEFSAEEKPEANHKPKGMLGAIRMPGDRN